MFNAIQSMPIGFVLCGVILSVTFGLAVGNYACSLVHRLPRGKLILDKTPYCGSCGTLLQVRDLFPLFSALALKHRCRYCGQPFPTSHSWTEALVALLFTLAFFRYGFEEMYILTVLLGVFLITLAAIEANERMIMGRVLLAVAVFGMVLRTLIDQTIFGFFFGGFFGLIAGLLVSYRQVKKVGHIYTLPPVAMLTAAGGLCVGSENLAVFLGLFLALGLAGRIIRLPLTAAFGLAMMLVIMYPGLLILP